MSTASVCYLLKLKVMQKEGGRDKERERERELVLSGGGRSV